MNIAARSSNGRTLVFGTRYLGSSPSLAAMFGNCIARSPRLDSRNSSTRGGSNGRTAVFGTINLGSSPRPAAKNMKKQILIIHGGETFDTYDDYIEFLKTGRVFSPVKRKKWKDDFQDKLGDDFFVLQPEMPCKWNAKYSEWKIWFEKVIPFIEDSVVIIGGSLGGIFIAKYLSENKFPKKILATYLLAAPYDVRNSDYNLSKDLSFFEEQGGKIYLYQSKDDTIVLPTNVEKYAKALPTAEKVIFEDKGHFIQEEFPELVESIKDLY